MDLGLTRHIGTSNITIPKLTLVLRDARIRPAVNEMELHPHFQQPELFDFVRRHGIEPIGYCPIGSPHRPARDRTPGDTADIEDPLIVRIAARLGVHPAVVCVKWAVQRGHTPIPLSTKPRNYVANLRATTTAPLTAEEMQAIADVYKRQEKDGSGFDFSYSLEPLAPFREYITIVSGADARQAEAFAPTEVGADHFRSSAVFLTATHPKQTGGPDFLGGISIDQLYAEQSQDTPLPSIQLGIEHLEPTNSCGFISVSYTHLDVYKRQGTCHSQGVGM